MKFNSLENSTASLESAAEQKKRTHLARAFENGLEDEEDTVGYHGTSLEAMEYLLQNGHLPGAADSDEAFGYDKGDLFFYPIKSKFLDHPDGDGFYDEEEAQEEVRNYSKPIAEMHFIMRKLGLDLGNSEDNRIGHELQGCVLGAFSDEAEKMIAQIRSRNGMSMKEINQILADSQKRKGVVLALSKNMLNDFPVGTGDDDGRDLRVSCPKGFDYSYICGIEPEGQEEWDFFEKIQKSVKS